MKDQNFAHGELQMTIYWAPQGKLENVVILPRPEEAVRACITRIIERWQMKPATSLQPFSYSVALRPQGV